MINAVGSTLSRYSDELLSVLRILSAFMFMQHGTQKMFGFPVEANAPYELMTLWGGPDLQDSLRTDLRCARVDL